MAQYSEVPLLAVGDYNNYLNHFKDKLPVPTNIKLNGEGHASFARVLGELSLTDVWCNGQPELKKYSCYSASHGGYLG